MAWRCSGSTNAELIENLFNKGLITSIRVKQAMTGVSKRSPTTPVLFEQPSILYL